MPRRSWTLVLAAALGAAIAGAALALAAHPGTAAAAPSRTCDQTVVVVEWHQAAPDKGLSTRCANPGSNPFDALQNANLSPVTKVESAVGTILCSILDVPAASCKQLPPHAAWTYWYVDPATREWSGPYESPPDTTAATTPSSAPAGGPGAVTGPQPSPAPPVEDWVYQSDYPAHVVKPAYDAQGTSPSATPSTTSAAPSPAPSPDPAPSTTPAPSDSRGVAPSLPAGIPTRSAAVRHAHPKSPRSTTRPAPQQTSTNAVDRAERYVPPQYHLPRLPDVSPPDQWWIAADRSGAATMTREGQASNTAWATAAPGHDSSHRVAWSSGLGAVAVVLLGIGVGAQLRRRRSG